MPQEVQQALEALIKADNHFEETVACSAQEGDNVTDVFFKVCDYYARKEEICQQ